MLQETEKKIMENAAFRSMLKPGGNAMTKTASFLKTATKHLLRVVGLGQDKKWESFLLVC